MRFFLCAFSFACVVLVVSAKYGKKTLVLYDNTDIKTTHSIFFKSLTGWFK